jgi:phage-related protein
MLMEFLSPILDLVLQLISPLLELVMQILTPILDLITSLLGPILELISDVLTPIFGIIQALLGPLTSLIGALLTPLCKLLEILLVPLTSLLDLILPPLTTLIEDFFQWASPYLEIFFEWLGNALSNLMDWIGEGGLTSAFRSFGDFFRNLWDGIVAAFKTAINWIIEGINALISGLNGIQPPAWLTELTGITGINLPTIPYLANGGDIAEAGRVIVGERGPEMLDLPRGARVTPLDQAAGIDYNKLTEAFVAALQFVAPQLAPNVTVEGDASQLVRVMVREDRAARKMTGRGLLEG